MSIQVVKYGDGGRQLELSVEDLERILLHDEIKDREVVCVSIAGAFRKGKSFLLDFFLRYLDETYIKKSINTNWMGDRESPLEGFLWRSGSSAVTTGIHMWSNIFLHDFDDGRKVAIILLDTQGTFDTKTTMENCTTIFALSTLLSSVQIFNLMQNIQENDLQHLQYFAEYGKLTANQTEGHETQFQKLLFLVRDWQYPDENEYGFAGGQSFLDKIFGTFEGQEMEHESLRSHIKSCFSHLQCFLMPHPGRIVTTSKSFEGKLDDIDVDFKNSLLELAPLLLAPENLIIKKINGRSVKASLFLEYFEKCFEILKNGELPERKTLFEVTAKVFNLKFIEECEQLYAKQMAQFCENPYRLDETELRRKHEEVTQLAINTLQRCRLMGGALFLGSSSEKLRNFINTEFANIFRENAAKRPPVPVGGIIAAIFSVASIVGAVLAAGGPVAAATGTATVARNGLPFLLAFLSRFFRR